jgi:hypothetical protein
MKKHILVKELGEGVCKTLCHLNVMRYEGIKDRYLPERTAEITCGRCRVKMTNAS